MEDIFVGLLMMILLSCLIPLYLWKRRVDSHSSDQHEEETQAVQEERVVRATGTRRMRRRAAASSVASTSSAAATEEGERVASMLEGNVSTLTLFDVGRVEKERNGKENAQRFLLGD